MCFVVPIEFFTILTKIIISAYNQVLELHIHQILKVA